MKEYIKFLVILFLLLDINNIAIAQSTKPTIKVGVFYTAQAAKLANGSSVNSTINSRVSTLKNLMAVNGLQTSYDIKVTALGLLNTYVEPKHRSRKAGDNNYDSDEYISIKGDGTMQVFQEVILHESFKEYYQSAEDNLDDLPGTMDDELQYDALDEDEIDISFINQVENVAPDVIIIIADEEGETFVADQSIRDVNTAYNKSLYIVLRADYFFEEDESLAYAFFNLFSNPGYSDADLGSDDPGVYSFLSDYWTGVEGTDLLSDTNKKLFKYNVGKLKLATANSGQIVFDGATDLTFQYSQTTQDVNSSTAIVFDGRNQSFAVGIPAATLANESNSNADIYGKEVKIANSYMAFISGEYTKDPSQQADPRSDNTPSTTPYTPPSFSLPIDFDNDITAGKKNQYISNYFGANASVTDGTTSNKDFLTITKYKGASNACAETVIRNIGGLTISRSDNSFQMDIKRGSNTSANDLMTVILTADDGSTLRSYETLLEGSSKSSWKTFEIKFNTRSIKTYTSMSIRFQNCMPISANRTYYVDNIQRSSPPDLQFTRGVVSNNKPKRDEIIRFTFDVTSKFGAYNDATVSFSIPPGFHKDPLDIIITRGSLRKLDPYKPIYEWSVGNLGKDEMATITLALRVNHKQNQDMTMRFKWNTNDADKTNNSKTVKAKRDLTPDFTITLTNNPFEGLECADINDEVEYHFEVKNLNPGKIVSKVDVIASLDNAFEIVNIPTVMNYGRNAWRLSTWSSTRSAALLKFKVRKKSQATVTRSFQLTVTAPTSESNNNNNRVTVPLLSSAHLKFFDMPNNSSQPIAEGGVYTKAYNVKNDGSCIARNVKLIVNINRTAFTNIKLNGASANRIVGTEHTWNLPNLGPGQNVKRTLTMNYQGGGSGVQYRFQAFSEDNWSATDPHGHYWIVSASPSAARNENDLIQPGIPASENTSIIDLAVYPNPFTGTFNIKFGAQGETKTTLEIYEMGGRLVDSEKYDLEAGNQQHEIQYDGSGLKTGLYLYRLKLGETYRSGIISKQ